MTPVSERVAASVSAPTPARAWPVALFDLDGTLSDSAPGILASIRATFDDFGLPRVDPVTELTLVGPPLRDSLAPFIGDLDIEDVLAGYRGHYGAAGMFDTTAYPGVASVLDALGERGIRMAVATSKAEVFAPGVLEHLGLRQHFEVVCGDDVGGGRGTKAAVVGEALRRLGQPAPADVIMIGDRFHDVIGAAAHGIATLGAGWGYGAPGELARAGALVVYAHPSELLEAWA